MPIEPDSTVNPAAAAVAPLRRLLAAVRRRARWWICVETLALGATAAAGTFWITLACDWAVEPPGWVRAAAVAVAAGGLVVLLVRKLVLRLAAPLPDAALAHLVERTHPAFRDSLSTAIDLSGSRGRDDGKVDAGLVARTIAEANRLVPSVRIGPLFQIRRLALLATVATGAAASIGWLAAVRPEVAGLWVRRMIRLADDPWPRRVRLEAEGFSEGVRTVARGADVEVLVQATAAAGAAPDLVELRVLGGSGWRTERMGSRGDGGPPGSVGGGQRQRRTFGHLLENVTADTEIEIRGGDARLTGLLLRVVDPPTLADIAIDFELPAYLGGGHRRTAASRIVRIPQGARVHVSCTASKPLRAAVLTLRSGGEPRPVGGLAEAGGRSAAADLGTLVSTATLTVQLTDTEGIESREPIDVVLSVTPDESPRVALRPDCVSSTITPQGRVPLVGTLSDDHGLASATTRIVRRTGGAAGRDREGPEATAAGTDAEAVIDLADATGSGIVRGGETLVTLDDRAAVVPLEPLRLPVGSLVELSVEARDACGLAGGPNRMTSDTWTMEVVSAEALRALLEAREVLLRRRFESVIADLARGRDQLHEPGPDARLVAIRRCGEAAARAAGETGDIAAAFRAIRDELANNSLSSPEVDQRLIADIAGPLADLAAGALPGLSGACGAADAAADPLSLAHLADEAVARMRAILDRMLEAESFNELRERLRGAIRFQEEIRAATLEEHKRRARAALEAP